MISLVLLALLAPPDVPPAAPQPPAGPGLAPEQAVAGIDDKGNLTLTRVEQSFPFMTAREVWLKAPAKKDTERVRVKAKVTALQLTVVELPARTVEAFTADGKAIPAAKLAEMLAKERTVLVARDGKKVDPFYLQLYKEGTIVLVPPAGLWGGGYGPPPAYGYWGAGGYGGYPAAEPILPPRRPPPGSKDDERK